MITPEQVLAEANQMGALPPCLPKLMSQLGSEDVDLGKVEQLLAGEPALVAALLRRANSTAFGARVEIGTVRDAVMRMGAPTALSVLTEVCMRGRKQPPTDIYGIDPGVRWQLSIMASLVAHELYLREPRRFDSTVVTAALLHDIGRIPLGTVAGTFEMDSVLQYKAANCCSLAEAEQRRLGMDGCEAGALVASSWHFPEGIVQALKGWARPEQFQDPVTDVVHLAAVLARMVGAASGLKVMGIRPSPPAAKRLSLNKESIAAIANKVTGQYAEIASEAAPKAIDLDAA